MNEPLQYKSIEQPQSSGSSHKFHDVPVQRCAAADLHIREVLSDASSLFCDSDHSERETLVSTLCNIN